MNRKYRKTIIAGNWKMNLLASQVKLFAESLKTLVPKAKWCETVVCVPYVMIPAALKAFKDSRVAVGAENVNENPKGAYTGEVSTAMLTDIGAKYVIIGHSERRQYYGETDFSVNAKLKAALEAGLSPILCVGESLQQREMDVTNEFITYQVKAALADIPVEKIRRIVIAYEPIWAIGTGKTATSDQAEEVCGEIRALIRKLYGARVARAVSILYGGSMNEKNAAELLSKPDIDGGLIGGASLVPEKFAAIINAANQDGE